MYRTLLCLLALAPPIALSAAQDSSGSPGTSWYGENLAEAHRGALVQRFVVPHIRSAEFSSSGGGRVTSVITATNGGAVPCDIAIDYYFAFNADTVPECTVNLTLAPLLATGADTANVCSRSIPGDRWTLCTSTCNPALSFMQGKAVVRAGQFCAADLALDARLYHSDTSENVIAITKMEVASDLDGDGIYDPNDNCSAVANPDQRDTNNDGHGNVCDFDYNNDCITNFFDLTDFSSAFGSTAGDANFNDDVDLDGNGVINFLDFGVSPNNFAGFFLQPPGPSDLQDACF